MTYLLYPNKAQDLKSDLKSVTITSISSTLGITESNMAKVDLAVANDHELDIKSTMMYRHEDYVDAIRLVNEKKVMLEPLITKVFPFEQYKDAYEYIENNREKAMKIIVNVQEDLAR